MSSTGNTLIDYCNARPETQIESPSAAKRHESPSNAIDQASSLDQASTSTSFLSRLGSVLAWGRSVVPSSGAPVDRLGSADRTATANGDWAIASDEDTPTHSPHQPTPEDEDLSPSPTAKRATPGSKRQRKRKRTKSPSVDGVRTSLRKKPQIDYLIANIGTDPCADVDPVSTTTRSPTATVPTSPTTSRKEKAPKKKTPDSTPSDPSRASAGATTTPKTHPSTNTQ